MATINVSFDTKDKTLEVTMDGKKMKNVTAVDFFRSFDGTDTFFAEIRSEQPNEDDGIVTITRVMAEEVSVHQTGRTEAISQALFGK